MARRILKWTNEIDTALRNRVRDQKTYEELENQLGVARSTLRRRSIALGVPLPRLQKCERPEPVSDLPNPHREPLRAGDPLSWDLINQGLTIEGEPYMPTVAFPHTIFRPTGFTHLESV